MDDPLRVRIDAYVGGLKEFPIPFVRRGEIPLGLPKSQAARGYVLERLPHFNF